MHEIYITTIHYEQTSKEKGTIDLIFPNNSIHYIVKGKGSYNGQTLAAGQGFITRTNHHGTYTPDPDDPWAYIWLRITGKDTDKVLDRYEKNGFIFEFDLTKGFSSMVQMLMQDTARLGDKAYASALFAILYAFHKDYEPQKLNIISDSDFVQHAKEYMNEHFYQAISMEDLANRLHISRAYLRNLFYQKEGLSPKQYLTRLRMEHAGKLLQNSPYSVTEVARSVGYGDVFQFIKIFKKHMGKTPTEYRKSACT